MDSEIYLLLGSNIGNREEWLSLARNGIGRHIGKVMHASSLYETAAWGKEDQHAFLNQVVCVQSALAPLEVLAQIASIEKEIAHRERLEKWAARTLDIDILFYGTQIINQPALTVPHPAIPLRRFTLVPLQELAPDFVHPVLVKSISQLMAECPDPLDVHLYSHVTC